MSTSPHSAYDVARLRRDFVGLRQRVHGHPLAYLDNASTTQKPAVVLDALRSAYEVECANVHRGVHSLSAAATKSYEGARAKVAAFIGAAESSEIVFTRGTTEAINLVANTFGRAAVGPDDRVLVTELEHHSNLVPWQMLCRAQGAHLDVLPVDDDGVLRLERLDELLTERTRVVAVAHVSNTLGTVNPVKEIVARAHAVGAAVVVDGAQAAPHAEVSVSDLGADFYAFSGHKLYAPTGIGALYGRAERLAAMPPWQGGGEMIEEVSLQSATYAEPPMRFEAGTPNIFGAIALGAALDYLTVVGRGAVAAHERGLIEAAEVGLGKLPGVRLLGPPRARAAALSFVLEGAHPHDVGTVLDTLGVAVRTGHHCTQPLMERFGVPATVRASFGLYNTLEEVDRLVAGVAHAQEVLGA